MAGKNNRQKQRELAQRQQYKVLTAGKDKVASNGHAAEPQPPLAAPKPSIDDGRIWVLISVNPGLTQVDYVDWDARLSPVGVMTSLILAGPLVRAREMEFVGHLLQVPQQPNGVVNDGGRSDRDQGRSSSLPQAAGDGVLPD